MTRMGLARWAAIWKVDFEQLHAEPFRGQPSAEVGWDIRWTGPTPEIDDDCNDDDGRGLIAESHTKCGTSLDSVAKPDEMFVYV